MREGKKVKNKEQHTRWGCRPGIPEKANDKQFHFLSLLDKALLVTKQCIGCATRAPRVVSLWHRLENFHSIDEGRRPSNGATAATDDGCSVLLFVAKAVAKHWQTYR